MSALDVVRDYVERMWNAHDFGVFDEFVSPDVRYHPPRGEVKDYGGYRAMAERFVGAFSDLHFEITGAASDGDTVALRLRITGTHDSGAHLGLPPARRRVDVQGRPWFRVADEKVVEVWSLYDERGMLEQLGAPSGPESAAEAHSH